MPAPIDLIAALELVVNTGFPTEDEHGNPHWAISERQRSIARRALKAALADLMPVPSVAYATLSNKRITTNPTRATVDATCSECGHSLRLGFADWDAFVCPGCKAQLWRGPLVK